MRAGLLPLVATTLLAACDDRPREFGVNVFAGDTAAVTFTMSIAGSLVMGLRADGFRMRPDSTLEMTTPAQLIVQSGDGSALIESVDGRRIAVQPLGVPPNRAADSATVEGIAVRVTRAPNARAVTLKVERP